MAENSKPLRGAIVGFGFISSKGHWPAYKKRKELEGDVEIVAIADTCPERQVVAHTELPFARIYPTIEGLLAQEADALDFVDIATPPYDHARIAGLCLEAGLHVLCEKPLTVKVEECQDLVKKAEKNKKVLFPVHNYKHAPVVKAVSELLQSQKIGTLQSVSLHTFRNTHAKGTPEWKTDWRREKKYSGGGIAMDHGSHSFYLLFDWFKSAPLSVSCRSLHLSDQDTEDNISLFLKFPKGFATVNLSWTAGVRKVIYTLQGSEGALTIDDDQMEVALMKSGDTSNSFGNAQWNLEKHHISSSWMDSSHVSWFNSLFDQFKKAIETKTIISPETIDACRCIQLIQAAYRSSELGGQEIPLSYWL